MLSASSIVWIAVLALSITDLYRTLAFGLYSQNSIAIQVSLSLPSALAFSLSLEGKGDNMTSKTLIEGATKTVKDAVKTAKSSANSASEKVKATTERAKAAIHEVKAEVSDNPITKVSENIKAGVGKVKAALHDAKAKTKK
jgi:hypothetical protein